MAKKTTDKNSLSSISKKLSDIGRRFGLQPWQTEQIAGIAVQDAMGVTMTDKGAEHKLLACLINDKDCLIELKYKVRGEMFSDAKYGVYWEASLRTAAVSHQGKLAMNIDTIVLGIDDKTINFLWGDKPIEQSRAEIKQDLERIYVLGGSRFTVNTYAYDISERYFKRKIAAKYAVAAGLNTEGASALDILNRTVLPLLEEIQDSIGGGEAIPLIEVVQEVVRQVDETSKARREGIEPEHIIATNIEGINRRMNGGFAKGTLTILAGRPGMGKSTVAFNIVAWAAERNKKCLVFSLEMPMAQVARIFISRTIFNKELRDPTLRSVDPNNYGKTLPPSSYTQGQIRNATMPDYRKFMVGVEEAAAYPIWINDSGSLQYDNLRLIAKRMKMQEGLDLIVIDYLQLIKTDNYNGTTNDLIGIVANGLKALAKELNVAIVCLSQLNRAVESRGGAKRPTLADLRESGKIEEAADAAIFVYRPEYYGIGKDEDGNSTKEVAELIFAKMRDGSTGTERAWMRLAFGYVGELSDLDKAGYYEERRDSNKFDIEMSDDEKDVWQ